MLLTVCALVRSPADLFRLQTCAPSPYPAMQIVHSVLAYSGRRPLHHQQAGATVGRRASLPPTSPIRVTGKGLRADQPIAEESGRRPQHKRHEVPLAQSNYTRLQSKSRDPVVMCRCFKQISNDAMALFADFFQHATSERATLKRDEKRQIQLVATLGNAVKMNPLMAKSMLSLAISKLSSTN